MDTSSEFSLRDNVRYRVLQEMVGDLKAKFSSVLNFILVIDSVTTKIISSSVKTVELLEVGVLAIEKLELHRKPFPETHAIYFVSPNEKTINTIIEDFSNAKNLMYGNIHLFFTSWVDNNLFLKLKSQKNLLERVLTFKELNIDFLSPEPNVFHLDEPRTLPMIFAKQGQQETNKLEESIAYRLSTVVPNLFDYDKFSIVYNKNSRNQVSERVSKLLMARINRFLDIKKAIGDVDDDEDPVPVKFVILDRTFDPLTPALRDYHYEPLVYEFLDVKSDNIVKYPSEDKTGQTVMKRTILDNKDELWMKYKYQFISTALANISREFESFIAQNANNQIQAGGELNVGRMNQMIKQLPVYEELLEKYMLHMSLCEKIVKIFNEKDLRDIGDFEQCLATGLDASKIAIPNQRLIAMLAKKMAENKLDDHTKLRLIVIACFALELNENERKQLTQSFTKANQFIISKLTLLGLNVDKGARRLSQKLELPLNMASAQQKNIPSNLCRHIPAIEAIVPEMISNRVDSDRYGSINTIGFDGALLSKANQKKIYQNTKLEKDQKKLPKLIFFVIGGISRSEIRALAEISKSNPNVKILMGSTSIMSASDYFDMIGDMAIGEVTMTDSQSDTSNIRLNIDDSFDL